MPCRYARRSSEAYRVDARGSVRIDGPVLCSWAEDAAPNQLVNVPRWMTRNAFSGHLLNYPDDCMGCPCFAQATEVDG